jgi:hypothetical protein
MTVFLISFLTFAVAVRLMSLGALLGKRPIQGNLRRPEQHSRHGIRL